MYIYIYIYIYKIKNWITFKSKSGYYFQILIPETIKLLKIRQLKIKIFNKYTSYGDYLRNITILLHYWQWLSTRFNILYKFVPNKPFGQLYNISPMNLMFLKTK